MQAIRLYGVGDLRLTECESPTPKAGEIVIRVEAAGICGTDRHLFKGEFPCAPPVTLGHEFSGIITARGAGVDLPLGTRVACDPNCPCGTCVMCRAGKPNLCPKNRAIGIHDDGGFATYAKMPAHRAHVLPATLNPLHGAFCEPLACTLHGVDIGAPRPGERVIVLGGGVIGQLAVQLAKLAGAEVMLVTRQPAKRRLAEDMGAAQTAATLGEAKSLWPQGANLVLECAGVPETMIHAPTLCAPGGRVVILGVLSQGAKIEIEPFDLLFREISLLCAFLNPFTQARAAELIANGTVQVAPLISRQISLGQAIKTISQPPLPDDVKVLILP